MSNRYFFKVANYQYPTQFYWIPPIYAKTYSEALQKLYNDEKIVAADLKGIETWAGIWKGNRDIYTPGVWDINV